MFGSVKYAALKGISTTDLTCIILFSAHMEAMTRYQILSASAANVTPLLMD
jgi:hypothetical protein